MSRSPARGKQLKTDRLQRRIWRNRRSASGLASAGVPGEPGRPGQNSQEVGCQEVGCQGLGTCKKFALFRIARPNVILRVAGVADRFEAEAVQCSGPEFLESGQVIRRAVSFIAQETVAGK